MDPFVLSRNAFYNYCLKYSYNNNNNQSLIDINHNDLHYERAIHTVNQRYEYFFQTLDQLRKSVEQKTHNQNINSISKDTLTIPSSTSKRSNKKHLSKSNKQRMPKVFITVRCREHMMQQQQPNVKIN